MNIFRYKESCRGYRPIFHESSEESFYKKRYTYFRKITSKIRSLFFVEDTRVIVGLFILNGFFYIFLFLITFATIQTLLTVSSMLQVYRPYDQNLIRQSPNLLSAVNGYAISSYDCTNYSTYENMVDNIQKMLQEYNSQVGLPFCTPGGNHKGKCVFDISTLDVCSGGDYGFSYGKPCIYIRLTKIIDFIPKSMGSNKNYVDISCHGNSATGEITDVEIFPKKGLLLDAFPYTYGSKNIYLSPLVAIVADATRTYDIRCAIMAANIERTTKYDLERSVGTIEIAVNKLSESCP